MNSVRWYIDSEVKTLKTKHILYKQTAGICITLCGREIAYPVAYQLDDLNDCKKCKSEIAKRKQEAKP